MADQPGDLGHVWNRVIADLSGSSPQSGAATLSSQQRAFLRLTRPLGLIDGTALLAAPSEFAKDAIERILRLPISEALGRHLGVAVTLAVVVDASAASGGSEVPDPIGNGARTDQRQRSGRGRTGPAGTLAGSAGHRRDRTDLAGPAVATSCAGPAPVRWRSSTRTVRPAAPHSTAGTRPSGPATPPRRPVRGRRPS